MRTCIILLSSLVWIALKPLSAQTWEVPDDQKSRVSPFLFTGEMVRSGESAYIKNCQSCHGTPGKDNWAKLVPPPGDLATGQVAKQTDGELFYKITAGKAPMPEFRNVLSDDERWHLVAYIRSFHQGYIQPEPVAGAALAGKKVNLDMSYDTVSGKIVVYAREVNPDGKHIPVAGAEVALFVQRFFGQMQIGETRTTGEKGYARLDWSTELPGDRDGNVILMVRLNDPAAQATVRDTLPIGQPTNIPAITDTRSMWNVRAKAPLWLILTYSISVVIVWGFILYILYQVIGIRKMSREQ